MFFKYMANMAYLFASTWPVAVWTRGYATSCWWPRRRRRHLSSPVGATHICNRYCKMADHASERAAAAAAHTKMRRAMRRMEAQARLAD